MEFSRNTYLEVNLSDIEENIKRIINSYNQYKYYFGVVKANCYGINNERNDVVKTIIDAGCNYLAVATLEEGIEIRKDIKDIPILVLGHITPHFIGEAIKNNITITLHSLEYLEEILSYDIKDLKMHIKINTGMNRLGIDSENEIQEVIKLCKENNLNVEGIYTHIYNANNEEDYLKQIENFEKITKNINLDEIPIIHISASDALVNYKKPEYVNGCRLGIIMYGFNDRLGLRCPIKLCSEIVQIHKVKKGDTVGYNGAFKADEDTSIAVIPIGYADGIIRKNTGREVYINNRKYKIVGNICMDMLFIQVDDNVKVGDKVYLLKDKEHIEYVAKYLDTIPYEVLTQIGNRIKRIMKK